MAVNVEIKGKKKITVKQIAEMEGLKYGVSNDCYVLEHDEIGDTTILFDPYCIARGIEVSFEKKNVLLRLSLPTSTSEIVLFYQLIKDICEHFETSEYIRDEIRTDIKENDAYIKADQQASLNALNDMRTALQTGETEHYFVFGALNPLTVGKEEIQSFNGNLDKFEDFMHRLQAKDVYYATPRFFQRKDNTVFGVFFIADEVLSVVPEIPSMPFNPDLKVDSYFVRIPENHTIPYEDFIQYVRKVEKYDYDHVVVSLEDDVIEKLALNYDVDMITKEKKEGKTLGRQFDDAFNHVQKIKVDHLPLDELAGYNHLAIYLRWCLEHSLVSERLLAAIPDLASKKDLRVVIRDEDIFNGCLRSIHFNDLGKKFTRKFYVFNSRKIKGFPHCVDLYAMEYFGKEKYHSKEFCDEAYLFVPFDEAYYQGLSKYIDKAWRKWNKEQLPKR